MANDLYTQSGVDYDPLDRFKRLCQQAAAATADQLAAHGLREQPGTRGESAYLLETPFGYLAHVEEGLGTKNLIADAMLDDLGPDAYRAIGIDTVATIVNDLITSGALPVSVAMHAAAGRADWFDHPHRGAALAEGFAEGCRLAGCVWGGGETPVLKGVVEPERAVLAGSGFGLAKPEHLIRSDLHAGDAIILLASSGLQTNGATLCRKLADGLPDGYRTKLDDGRTFGAALLEPSVIYAAFVRRCQEAGVTPGYAVHVTGHGWRKLMRARPGFVYRITQVPPEPALFAFIRRVSGMSLAEAYATFNMGVGFAVYVKPTDVPAALAAAQTTGYTAWEAGRVEKQGDRKAVVIEPLGITYEADTLQLRA